jgi:hypothetical protein
VSRFGDVGDEMTGDQLDEGFERFLAGRPVPPGGAAVVAFAEEVRQVAAQPGRPSAQLAELLATGLLTDLADTSAGSVAAVSVPAAQRAAGRPRRRRRKMIEFLTAGLLKLASAGAIAQAATGVTVAVVGVTGAGAAGALPGPVQSAVAGAVEFLTPLEFPGSAAAEHLNETPGPGTGADTTTGADTSHADTTHAGTTTGADTTHAGTTTGADTSHADTTMGAGTGTDGAAETGADPAGTRDHAGSGSSAGSEDARYGGQVSGEGRDTHRPTDADTPAQTWQRPTTAPETEQPAPAPVTTWEEPPTNRAPQQDPASDQGQQQAPSAPDAHQSGAWRP